MCSIVRHVLAARPAEDKNQVGEWYNARAQKDADQSGMG